MLFQDTFSCSYTTPYHRVANAANAFDLDFHDIPVMQKERGSAFEPHSRWRPCRDDIAWLQGHEGTEESDHRGHRKDHISGRVMLYHLLIHPGGERERLGIGNAGCQDDPWSHRRKGIHGFASRRLTGLHLHVTRAHIVHDGIDGHILERLLLGIIFAALADDVGTHSFMVKMSTV